MEQLKKIIRSFVSMKVAIAILVVLTAACVVGSVIPQGEYAGYYEMNYPATAKLILGLSFNDVFHSDWFVVLTIVLCLNLLGCNLIRFPTLLKRFNTEFNAPAKMSYLQNHCSFMVEENPQPVFKQMGFKKIEHTCDSESNEVLYAVRNRIGIMGAWLTHLGMLMIIAGFALGQIYAQDFTVYGVPGQTKAVEGSDLTVTINDFHIDLREDDTVEQYTANITVKNSTTGHEVSGETSVNHPLNAFGYEMYQNATGYAADVLVYKNGELLQTDTLCVGEYLAVSDLPDLKVAFYGFYPDYVTDSDGMPANASNVIRNPAYLYILYYGEEMLGMNILQNKEMITVSDYNVILLNPRMYTLIQIKYDPFQGFALAGGIVILIALFVSFYCVTEELWAVKRGEFWYIGGKSRKGGLLYQDKLQLEIRKWNGLTNQVKT